MRIPGVIRPDAGEKVLIPPQVFEESVRTLCLRPAGVIVHTRQSAKRKTMKVLGRNLHQLSQLHCHPVHPFNGLCMDEKTVINGHLPGGNKLAGIPGY